MCHVRFGKSQCLKSNIPPFQGESVRFQHPNVTIGRMKRSNFGGLRVKPSPTKQGLVTKRFHAFSKRQTDNGCVASVPCSNGNYFVVFLIEQHERLPLR
jgi:hypothetical protein